MRRFVYSSRRIVKLFGFRHLSVSKYRGPLPKLPPDATSDAAQERQNADIDSVLQPLERQQTAEPRVGEHAVSERKSADCWVFQTKVVDKFGMDAHVEPLPSFEALSGMLPEQLNKYFSLYRKRFGLKVPTSVQQVAFPLIFQGRDVLCIAPTGSGKSVCYLVPTIARALLDQIKTDDGSTGSVVVDQSDIEAVVSAKIARGEICKYCELEVGAAKVCPITGHLHKPPDDPLHFTESAAASDDNTPRDGPTAPVIVVLVPTSELALQVHQVCMSFRCTLKVAPLVRVKTEAERNEQKKLLKGCDVIIATPEPLIQAVYKRQVSLSKTQTIVLDEVDSLLGTASFEFIKIILARLPKHEKRPQRLLFGATLPPSMYEMIRDVMLLPSHRFITGDVLSDQRIGSRNSNITHLVFLVSRAEKIEKIRWLYDTQRITANQRTIIFCNSRHNVDYVTKKLKASIGESHQVRIVTMDSRTNAEDRERAKKLFQGGICTVMVCTDLMSRGIDFHGVMYVVHYEMPLDFEVWTHRSGRCGRHGLPGYCYSLFTPEDVRLAKPLVAHLRQTRQIVPAKLVEYSNSSFVDIFKNSLLHHPTKTFKRRNQEVHTPAHGRGVSKYPDYKHQLSNREAAPA